MKFLFVRLSDANSTPLTTLTTLGRLSNRFDKVTVDASSSEVMKAFVSVKVSFTSATVADVSLEELQSNRNSLYVVVDQTMDFKNANDSLISLLTAANKDNSKIIVISDPADYSLLFQANFISLAKKQALQRKVCAILESYYHYKATTAATASATSTSSSTSGTVVKCVLVVGSGGREHAIVHQLLSSHDSSAVTQVYVAPGNAGTQGLARCENVSIGVEDVDGLVQFASQQCVDLVIVGPEQPLVLGLVDAMHSEGIPCFGPNQAASIIEASKAWSKDFMARHGIPTAAYRTFTEAKAAKAFVADLYAKKAAAGQVTAETPLVVVKASGLAAGKGVLIPLSLAEAIAAIEQVLEEHAFGSAGNELIVEEYLVGEEISLLAFADGRIVCGMPPAQDHKRVFDGDLGLNTGGMGAYAPTPCIDSLTYRQCLAIVQQTVTAMQQEGCPFHGVLYAGFILTKEAGPMVLEYNARFGDPETQVLLPLLTTNLAEVALACVEGRLEEVAVNWRDGMQAATVVIAAPGYPEAYKKGVKVLGLDGTVSEDTIVYHAGTAVDKASGGAIVSNGGRLLAITGLGKTLQAAVDTAYQQIRQGGADRGGIRLEGNEKIHYRTDIAKRGLLAAANQATAAASKPVKAVRIGVLGSTRGSSLQPILDAIQQGTLPGVTVSLVISNKKESGILARARSHGIPTQFLGALNKTREQYDAELAQQFLLARCDLVLLIGYMRIVSLPLIQAYPDRLFNVHPSLLPDFAGGMDLEVHRAVLAAGKIESGCTVHVADESLDGGRIVVQKRVGIAQDGSETAESLKTKVQALEGPAFMEVIRQYQQGQLLCRGDDSQPWNNKPAASKVASKAAPGASITYRDAGVDIDAGEALVDLIKPYCKATVRSGCDAELGGFGGLFDLAAAGYDSAYLTGSATSNSSGVLTPLATYDPIILVSGTDGVGTKLKIAQSIQQHDTIGIDLVAMCVNDILVCGAEPLFFLDYYATGALQVQEASLVVKGIAQGCAESGCALIGGETAEMAGKED